MTAYYNENDPYAAQWLRNLIDAGHIAPGEVDERSIVQVSARDVAGYNQCHFFAGIGGWSYALRLAGWPDDVPVWTGSCPCQPFSAAGRRAGFDDERHLWPAWFALIRAARPAVVFGEQVEAAVRLGWLDAVFADLEGEGYACGAAVLGAHSVGAPHIRQRLWFVAYAKHSHFRSKSKPTYSRKSEANRSANQHGGHSCASDYQFGRLGDAGGEGRIEVGSDAGGGNQGGGAQGLVERPLHERSRGPWSDLEWLPCRDGKARPTRPGIFPLAHGLSGRVGKLRAAGNAIVPQVAAEFIRAYAETGEQ